MSPPPCLAPSRRRALLTVGAGLLTPLLLQACGPAPKLEPPGPAETLMAQHAVLARILAAYRRAALALRINPGVVDAAALADASDLFRSFGEDMHEGVLEEAFVFPRLKRAGGANGALVDIMLAQHQRGRALTGFVHAQCASGPVSAAKGEAVARALESMANMYEAHAGFEATVVYPAWKALLSPSELHDLGRRFVSIQQSRFKEGGQTAVNMRLAGIERRLGVPDASAYTAPAPSEGAAPTGPPGAADTQD